ncbi:helix-turn-helix domain-containing protein [Brachybacterium massiliense]|uniref:helix-turn-helix domain-containing protein n=1 Tax=Brachybacterium massiliense TaxID=1755098 RepID=UPI000B3BB7CC|nr:helix-turn-helix transcriptional regulator [Brachybacterium massiliense]
MNTEPNGTQRRPTRSASTEAQRIGATLRTIRELRGFTVDELAREVGISRPYLANIEAGRKPLSDVLLAKLSNALRVRQLAIMRPDLEESTAA